MLGYGPGGYARIYIGSADATRTGLAHNTVLEQTVEAGIAAGLGAAVVTLAGLARALPQLRSRDPISLAWACVATAVIISGLYDFTWTFPPLAAVGLVALARLSRHSR
jgi:O-antigen ligase